MITVEERNVLIDEMMEVLEGYGYNPTKYGVGKIVDRWAEQKWNLIEFLQNHPKYVSGKYMVAFTVDEERGINKEGIQEFVSFMIDEEHDIFKRNARDETEEARREANRNGNMMLDPALQMFIFLAYRWTPNQFVDEALLKKLNGWFSWVEVHPFRFSVGQKVTRVVRKICDRFGYSKIPEFDKYYAKFADALSPMKIKRYTVLSCHPVDYLLMSHGNSWTSCHTIDKEKRDSNSSDDHWSLCHSSGTVSYMLDRTSMVYYQMSPEEDENNLELKPKVVRQMYHYQDGAMITGRLYPQGNDNYGDVYTPHREIVERIISESLGVPNLWKIKKGDSACRKHDISKGTHYEDYQRFDTCNFVYLRGTDGTQAIEIGENPICIRCGEEHYNSYYIDCCSVRICPGCGREIRIDVDDCIEIDGEYYCDDCVICCDHCENYHPRSDMRYVDSTNQYVCNGCVEEDFVTCSHCGELVLETDAFQDVYGEYYCVYCFEHQVTEFDGEMYPKNEVGECTECGAVCLSEDMIDGMCPDCYEEEEDNE